jgi:hypothetical protein
MKGKMTLVFCLALVVHGFGQITFQKTYGGTIDDVGLSARQTTDGGYIICGLTTSFGAGSRDVYLVKTDSIGDTLWTKTYGGTNDDVGESVQQTADGGYIITGYTKSFGVDSIDVYLIKTNPSGDTLWTKTYGGTGLDDGYSVQQTTDGGYVIAGATGSFGPASFSVYLIKTDINGNSLWSKTFGGTDHEHGSSIHQTTDGGYIIAGSTGSFGAGGDDVYLIKTNATGDTLWTKTFGGTNTDAAESVQQTVDGGYIITGYTSSFGAGNNDIYLIKTDTIGDTLWTKTFGGISSDGGSSVQQTTDGGYVMAGSTASFGAGSHDVYLIKTDANGDSLWTKTFGGIDYDDGYSVQQTTDGGFIIAGYTWSYGAGAGDICLIKTDSLGNSGCNQTDPATVVGMPATIVTNPATVTTSPATVVTFPATIVGSGGVVNTQCISTGIQSPNNNQQTTIGVSPNPAFSNSEITFTYPSLGYPSEIVLNNIDGKEVGRYALPLWSSVQHLKLPKLAEGVYVARFLNAGAAVANVKFVISE